VEIFLYLPPKKLDEIQFTMEFGQKNAQVPCCFNYFLYQRLLLLKVGLQLQDPFVAAFCCTRFTFLAFPPKVGSEKTTFGKNGLDTFWLVRVLGVAGREYHILGKLFPITDKPRTVHSSLLSSRSDIHS
jgi:hypothetical protein